jgi:BA14K-like protein
MLPSLPDRTNMFVAAAAAVAVALCNVVFATDWVSERPLVRTVALVPDVAEPPIAAPAKSAVPQKAAPPAKATAQAPEPDLPAAAPAETPSPLCDVDACAAAYRTFQASDCTYAPSLGVRRLCTKGKRPQ